VTARELCEEAAAWASHRLPLAVPTAQRWGYSLEPRAGPLWKSESGELSNLRWDIKPSDVPFYFKQVGGAW
jgi:hypothetical protein